MIKAEIKSKKSGYYEQNIRAIIKSWYDNSAAMLTSVESSLIKDIEALPRKNTAVASVSYKVKRATDEIGQHLVVQHMSSQSDPDWVVAIIRDIDKPQYNWIEN